MIAVDQILFDQLIEVIQNLASWRPSLATNRIGGAHVEVASENRRMAKDLERLRTEL